MSLEHPTPPLPISSVLRSYLYGTEDLEATQAHQVMLHCALDAAGVPVRLQDADAVDRIAELDYPTVNAVIGWLRTAKPDYF